MSVLRSIFPPSDPTWAWRRRMAFTGNAVALWGFIDAVKFEPDHAWGAIVLSGAIGLWTFTMGIYYGGAHYSEKTRLENEQKVQP